MSKTKLKQNTITTHALPATTTVAEPPLRHFCVDALDPSLTGVIDSERRNVPFSFRVLPLIADEQNAIEAGYHMIGISLRGRFSIFTMVLLIGGRCLDVNLPSS
jgi:hypothetical protein